ncbi:MAG: MAPEG family protein [Pseudomonadota bacterium]
MLLPVLALVAWTLIVWGWMYATRLPAMAKEDIPPQNALHPGALNSLPSAIRVVADNYNHLHEQPTLFYALAFYIELAETSSPMTIGLAWGYVGSRVLHSFAQIVLKQVPARFVLFCLSSVILVALVVISVIDILV